MKSLGRQIFHLLNFNLFPKEPPSDEGTEKLRILFAVSGLLIIISLLFGVTHIIMSDNLVLSGVFLILPMVAIVVLLLVRNRVESSNLVAHLFCSFVFLAIGIGAYYTGGLVRGNSITMLIIPVTAILLLERGVLIWLGTSFLMIVVLLVLTISGFPFPKSIPPEAESVDLAITVLVTFLMLAGILLYTENARRQSAIRTKLAQKKAEAANRAKGQFLANISHEIRTPLNGVIGITELALRSQLSDQVRQHLEMIRSSADSLLTLVNDILDYSRVEAGRVELERSDFRVRKVVDSIVDMVRVRVQEKGLNLHIDVSDSVPKVLVGDAQRFGQVLLNLLSNAVKFTDQGQVRVSTWVRTLEAAELELEVSIQDTGIGIAEDRQQAIFETFTQADGSTTRRFGGTGLGLAISAKLVKMMGGTIVVESKPNRGSTFSFSAWFGWKGQAQESIDDQSCEESNDCAPPEGTLRILLAEDNAINQHVTVSMLSARGHQVEVVNNGLAAVQAVSDKLFDVVLMDVQMPDMDGLEATRRIRRLKNADKPRLRIIAMTAHALPGDKERCLAAGMDGYLAKPVRPQELYSIVEGNSIDSPVDETMPEKNTSEVLNTQELYNRTRGDQKLVRELIGIFRQNAPKLMSEIEKAQQAQDADAVYRAAHSLKGAAAMLGAVQVYAIAYSLELAGRHGKLADAAVAQSDLQRALRELEPALDDLLA